MTNEEVEEAQIIEVEEEVTLDESQPAEISLDTSDGNNEPQGLSEEDLDKRREKTQKRINKLVAQRKESEEREAAAMQFAQQQKNEVDALRGQLSNLNTGYSSEASSRIDSQEIQAKTAFKEAYEAGEVDKMADAQQVMAKIAIEKERLRIFKDNQEKQKQRAVQVQEQQFQQQAQPQQPVQEEPDAKAVDWAEREENSWFGQDRAMTATAFTIHQQLVEEEGLDPQSDEYYSEIDARMRQDFPHKFNGKSAPAQRVASVSQGRTSQKNKKSVKLTPAQISVAKKLGVPLDAYAKEVAKIAARDL
tara:strand:- start:2188 stop:3102 length:915 start_codon:yes stop_codon:yes gene_type:complete